jgi:SAM-dependent methyltransferase
MSKTTAQQTYTDRLAREQLTWWKRWLDVQAPYRAHLRRLRPGFMLEVGCGIGRNLLHVSGNGVGVDHNAFSVQTARARGLLAFTPEEFESSEFNRPQRFDSLLLAHLLEHLTTEEAAALVGQYLPLVRDGGRVLVMTPQEWGHWADPTHVEFMDFVRVHSVLARCGLTTERQYSFPLPRVFGRLFRYNEFVTIGRKRAAA